jgi:hypothetical protein
MDNGIIARFLIAALGLILIVSASGCLTGQMIRTATPYCGMGDVVSVQLCQGGRLKVVYDTPGKGFEIVSADGKTEQCQMLPPEYMSESCLEATGSGFCQNTSVCSQIGCVLSSYDCKCYMKGTSPEETNGARGVLNCSRENGASGCAFSRGECRNMFTENSTLPVAERAVMASREFRELYGKGLSLYKIRPADPGCKYCWEYEFRFSAEHPNGTGADTYSSIVLMEDGVARYVRNEVKFMSCESLRDCISFGCTKMFSNAKCEMGKCVCEACCDGDHDCDRLGSEYVCAEKVCQQRISPGTLPPEQADCIDRRGEYVNGPNGSNCIMMDMTCSDVRYHSAQGCYGRQLDKV